MTATATAMRIDYPERIRKGDAVSFAGEHKQLPPGSYTVLGVGFRANCKQGSRIYLKHPNIRQGFGVDEVDCKPEKRK